MAVRNRCGEPLSHLVEGATGKCLFVHCHLSCWIKERVHEHRAIDKMKR